jgi:phenylpyruvate tautomerase PptA (4-oxalocrotonate tautomerase family)
MPIYTITGSEGALDQVKKARIAGEVTRIHSQATGAAAYLVQVQFRELAANDCFLGGAAIEHPQLFVHGQIRSGRSADQKDSLISGLLTVVTEAAALPQTAVWVYLVELPAGQMVEFGHVLPAPGHEQSWLAGLPKADREFMERVGTAKSPGALR